MKTVQKLYNGAVAGTGTAFAGLALAAALTALPVQSVRAQWFKCPSGQYQLETITAQNKARCIKESGRTRVQPDAGCPAGTTFDDDHRGTTDYCLPVTGTIGPRAFPSRCGPGQQEERRTGRDHCYKNTPADIKPVSTPG